ncbi:MULTISPECIES: ROK family protein [unclassified Rummeliibacillus]|uniref:ROK family protein n=1 Tax=unclassified Rummeliibacillus TaxID=2622809 RepID=UPI000E662F81|nr:MULTISPECIES: ROK family protein [unclassified Rummeliibacillus]RIJ64266.1 ROK family protein [Rummeliibacillus sp. POC4]RPJ94754.1 ROK family protein [Rummeliibacillus sp. TYF005]
MSLVLGVDIGGTKIRIGVVSETGEVIADTTIPTKLPLYPYLEEKILEVQKQFPNLIGIGIGTRGMVDSEEGIVTFETELPGWKGTHVKKQLQAATGIRVEINNDANCAALAESYLGSAKDYRRVVCLTVGTKLGGGIIIDGNVMNGAHGGGGEIGHMILYPNGILCGCGRYGCSEEYVSGTALRRLILNNNVIDPKTEELVTPHELFKMAANGHKGAIAVRNAFLTDFAIVISNLQAILDMDCVVIGGGVSESSDDWWSFLLTEVEPLKLKPLEIKKAVFGNEAGMLGAALLVIDRSKLLQYRKGSVKTWQL